MSSQKHYTNLFAFKCYPLNRSPEHLFWRGRQGHGGGISSSLLKKTRAMIDANRVIRLYLKGVVDSQSIKVKSAALVTA